MRSEKLFNPEIAAQDNDAEFIALLKTLKINRVYSVEALMRRLNLANQTDLQNYLEKNSNSARWVPLAHGRELRLAWSSHAQEQGSYGRVKKPKRNYQLPSLKNDNYKPKINYENLPKKTISTLTITETEILLRLHSLFSGKVIKISPEAIVGNDRGLPVVESLKKFESQGLISRNQQNQLFLTEQAEKLVNTYEQYTRQPE